MSAWFRWRRALRRNALWRRYQLGIYNRYLCEEGGWEYHLRCSRQRVLEFTERNSLQSLTILGSGWLLDVPLDELVSACQRVILIDRYHPRQSVDFTRRYGNVELLEFDVTGGLEWVVPSRNNWQAYLERIKNLKPPTLPSTNGVVSLNLLSQLAMPIQEHYANRIPEAVYAEAATMLENQHAALLSRYAHWMLITDTEERHCLISSGSKLPSVKTVISELPPLQNRKSWEWAFDSKGRYAAAHRVELHVESGEGSF